MLNLQINGLQHLQAKIKNLIKDIPKISSQSTHKSMGIVIEWSKWMCPVDTSALRSSTYVDEPVISGNYVEVRGGYGGRATQINPKTNQPTTTYMFKVHETHLNKSKFLEQAFEISKEEIVKDLRNQISILMRG